MGLEWPGSQSLGDCTERSVPLRTGAARHHPGGGDPAFYGRPIPRATRTGLTQPGYNGGVARFESRPLWLVDGSPAINARRYFQLPRQDPDG